MRRFERKIRNKLKAWGCTNKDYLNWRTQHTKALNRRMRWQVLTKPGYQNYRGEHLTIVRNWKDEVSGIAR